MDMRQLIVEYGQKMLREHYTIETWGNISAKGEDGLVYITPSGMDYETCTADDIIVMTPDKKIISGSRKPSIETDLHLSIYKARPEVGAVIHSHPMYSTVFACMGETVPIGICDESAQVLGAETKTAKYALPGSPELAVNCLEALGKASNACLLQSHGAVTVGADLKGAFKVLRVLEMTLEVYQRIRSMGATFLPISEENIKAMQKYVVTEYGQPKE